MTEVLSTDTVAPRERAAYWRELVCQTFVQAQCDTAAGGDFRGSLSTARFDAAELSRLDAGAQRIVRRPADIARVMKPRYYLCWHAAGRGRYRERAQDSVVGPGDLILLDNCEPYIAEYTEPVTAYVLHLPHALLRDRCPQPERLLGQRLDGARGLPRIAGEFLRTCLDQSDVLPDHQRPALAGMALDLVVSALAEGGVNDRADPDARQRLLLARLKQYVHAHLGDPGLDLDRLAAATGISARHVSRLFQQSGDRFSRYLLAQRIERCRRQLADPAFAHRRISDLALDHGFSNFAHFSRVFREAVGCTPSDCRASGR